MFRKSKKDRDTGPANRQFYVEFFGWLPSLGVQGSIYTNPVAYELIKRLAMYANIPKMTLQVSSKEIKIFQTTDDQKKKSPQRHTIVKMNDIMFATCLPSPNTDIAACIFRAYNTMKACALQVHVYRFDSAITAETFVTILNTVIQTVEHQSHVVQVDEVLRRSGLLERQAHQPPPPLFFSKSPTGSSPTGDAEPHSPTFQEDPLVEAITNELKQKFKFKEAPLLLPPKDYDTVRRKQGSLDQMGTRKCRNNKIVGRLALPEIEIKETFSDSDSKLSPSPQESFIYYPIKKSPSDQEATQLESPPTDKRMMGSPEMVRLRHHNSTGSNSSRGKDQHTRISYSPSGSPTVVSPHSIVSGYEVNPNSFGSEVSLQSKNQNKSIQKSPPTDKRMTGSPEMVRLRHHNSTGSNSSRGKEEHTRISYSASASPTVVSPHSIVSGYEVNRNSFGSEVSPQNKNQKKNIHKRENSSSSVYSGSSNHSDSYWVPSPVVLGDNYEIPPDYDNTPTTSTESTTEPRTKNISTSLEFNDAFYTPNGPYRMIPQMDNRPNSSHLDLRQNYSQPNFKPVECYSKSAKRSFKR